MESKEQRSNSEREVESHLGRQWRIAGFLLVSLALGLINQLQAEQRQLEWKSLVIMCALAVGSFYGGLQCYIRGKKLKALSAQAAMAQDGRPPVLYLRSFVDDPAASVSPIARWLGLAAMVFGISTEEEQLAEGLKDTALASLSVNRVKSCRSWERPACMSATQNGKNESLS